MFRFENVRKNAHSNRFRYKAIFSLKITEGSHRGELHVSNTHKSHHLKSVNCYRRNGRCVCLLRFRLLSRPACVHSGTEIACNLKSAYGIKHVYTPVSFS